MRNNVFVISAPSGAGKGTVIKEVLNADSSIRLSCSCTTRSPRAGEVDGVQYEFITREVFEAKIERGEFLEWAEVHGNYYGTLASHLEAVSGADVLLELDVQGARQVRARLPKAIMIFILPPSFEELEKRLRGRGTDSEETIQRRLRNAPEEMRAVEEFDFFIINSRVNDAVRDLKDLIQMLRSEDHAPSRMRFHNPTLLRSMMSTLV